MGKKSNKNNLCNGAKNEENELIVKKKIKIKKIKIIFK